MRRLGSGVFGGYPGNVFTGNPNSTIQIGKTSPLRPWARWLGRTALLLALMSIAALKPDAATAQDVNSQNDQAAQVAVDIFVKGANLAGLPITPDEAGIVTQIVKCGLNGTDAGDCARNIAVATALQKLGTTDPTIANTANCLMDGKSPQTCGAEAVISQLPAQAQPAANCVLSGGNVADCTTKLAEGVVLEKVPNEVRPLANCMIEKGDPKTCGADFVVSQVTKALPGSVKNIANQIANCIGAPQPATCLASAAIPPSEKDKLEPVVQFVGCATQSGADPAKCMGTFAQQNLPDGIAKNLAGCVGASDFAKCAEQNVKNLAASQLSQTEKDALAALQQTIATIDKLRPGADINLEAGRNGAATLNNIMMVADGIRKKDWGEVIIGAGPELAKIASNIILSVFLTPAVAAALSPAVEAMINNDVVAAKNVLNDVANGDPVKLAGDIFEWYENSFIDKPCALIGEDASKVICGPMSDAIKFISATGQDLAKDILSTGKDILQWLGVWDLADGIVTDAWNTLKGAVEDVGHFFGIGDDEEDFKPDASCGTLSPVGYYADHYLACVRNATDAAAGSGNISTSGLDADCATAFNKCVAPKNRSSVTQLCGAMSSSLKDLATQVSDGMKTAAAIYTNMGGPANYVNSLFESAVADNFGFGSRDFCDPNFWDAATAQAYVGTTSTKGSCAYFVNAQFPSPKPQSMGGPACGQVVGGNATAARQVCLNSLNANTNKNALVGPGSDYCKRQQNWEALHPCTWDMATRTTPSGQVFGEPKNINCKDLTPRIPSSSLEGNGVSVLGPKYLPSDVIFGPGGLGPTVLHKLPPLLGGGIFGPGGLLPSVVFQSPFFPGGGHGPVVIRPFPLLPGGRLDIPVVFKLPPQTEPLGGFGGPYYANSQSGNAPISATTVLHDIKPFLLPPAGDCKDPRGCGGWNGVNNNTNEGTLKKPPKKRHPVTVHYAQARAITAGVKPPRLTTNPPLGGGGGGTNSAMDRLAGSVWTARSAMCPGIPAMSRRRRPPSALPNLRR